MYRSMQLCNFALIQLYTVSRGLSYEVETYLLTVLKYERYQHSRFHVQAKNISNLLIESVKVLG